MLSTFFKEIIQLDCVKKDLLSTLPDIKMLLLTLDDDIRSKSSKISIKRVLTTLREMIVDQ